MRSAATPPTAAPHGAPVQKAESPWQAVFFKVNFRAIFKRFLSGFLAILKRFLDDFTAVFTRLL